MRIGIDIDGVLINIYTAIVDNATKYCYENNINYKIEPSEYDESKMLNISNEHVEKFWNNYLGEYAQKYPVMEFAAEVIQKLKIKNEIYIITARNEEGLPPELYGTMQSMVKEWLNKNKIEYDKIIFSPEEKLNICKANNINIMIEDRPETILEISKEIPVICFEQPYNRKIEGKNIIRAYSWYDILNKIEKM